MELDAPEPQKLRTLEPTWWIMDREPGMDDLAEQAGDSLQKMGDNLKIYPFQDRSANDRLFLGRFEFPKYGEGFQFSEAVTGDSQGFIDFLAGCPIDCVEMLVLLGEYSTQADEVTVKDGDGKAAAPVPDHFFVWPEMGKVLLNLTALPIKDVAKILAKNLEGEPKPTKAHWWFRVQLTGGSKKFPVPGEFLGLGVRMMPDVPWGKQKSSPFIYSGNWMDTVYLTGGRITEVIAPTDTVPYSTYKVRWRKDVVTVRPTDFAEYKVGDRVTIIKDITTTKQSQLWKDDDMKTFGETWMIAPIGFYGLDTQEEG